MGDSLDRMALQVRTAASAQAMLSAVNDVDPPQARRDAELQRQAGFPLPVTDSLSRTLASVAVRQNEVQDTLARAPMLAPYLADSHTYGRIGDDLHTFGDIADAIHRNRLAALSGSGPVVRRITEDATPGLPPNSPVTILGNAGVAIAESFLGGAIEMGGRVLQGSTQALRGLGPYGALSVALLDRLGGGSTEAATRRYYAPVAHYGQNFAAPTDSAIVNRLQTAAQSAGGSAVTLLASAATRNPLTGVAVAGLSQEERAYEAGIAAGLDPHAAQRYADIDGLIEGGLEYISNRFFVGDVSAHSGFLTTLRHQILSEVPSEIATTVLQDVNRYANIDAAHGQSIRDFVATLPGDMLDTAITTLLATGMTTGVAHPIGHVIEQHLQGVRAQADSERIGQIMDAAAGSATRRESPEDFRRIVQGLSEGTPVENLYIPAENVRQLFQSPEDMAAHPFWGGYANEINEAQALGGDVVVPLADAATHLSGTPDWNALRDHVRTSPGGMSEAEARDVEGHLHDEIQRSAADLTAQIEAEHQAMEPARQVYEAMRQQLEAAGMRPDAASNVATLFTQRQSARAERMGVPLTGNEASALEVRSATSADNPTAGARILSQTFRDGPRGRITFAAEGPARIDLFENHNLSTAIHEFGHHFLEEMRSDASQAGNVNTAQAQQVFGDFETIKAWFAREGHPTGEDGSIPTAAHELFARGFERYAMEGKAPSSALRRAFEAFRSWLLNIYKTVAKLRSPITPEIRNVMNRMLATDDEIQAARESQLIKNLFTSAEQAGMSSKEFAAYEAMAEEARGDAHTELLKRVMANVRAARTKEWREQEANVRGEVAAATDAQPVFRALRLLRTGKLSAEDDARNVKLDKLFLIDTYGPEALDQMPKSVPPIYAETNTTNADDIAEQTGFRSGDEMIRTLMGHEQTRQELRARGDKRSPRQVLIDEGTAQKMAERHGDPLRDGSIEDEARALIHNDKQGEVIAAEIRALARQANRKPTPYSIAKQWAAEKIAGGKVSDVASGAALQQYERAARRASKAAEEAILKGDADETYRQKQAQMLNNALISAAKAAKDRVEIAVRRLSRLARRKTMASIDQGYLDQIHDLLEQVELKPRSQAALDRQESFEAWAKAQEDAGHDIVVPASFATSLGSTHWSRLNVENLIGLDDTVQQILHLGRLKQTLLDGQERRSFDELVGEAESAAGKLPPRAPSDLMEPSFGERLKGKVAAFDSALLKIETLVDWLDSKSPNGVFNRIVFKPIAEAQARSADMFAEYMGKLNEALGQVPKKTLRRWGDRVTVPELLNRETGNPFVMTRQQLVSMALNMGNEQNAQRLADGYGWTEPNIMAALNRELTSEEWAYVQNVWDTIGGLWPHIETMEKNINGIAPEKVPARPLETAAGTLAGGYFPAVYDSTRDYTAEKNAARESDLFEARYTRATTRASATKERADVVKRPILLDLGVITRHVGEVIHDITHREAVMNADKFLSSRRVMKAIDNSLGPQMRAQFRPWLKFVANQWAAERAGNEGIGKFINKLRANATVVGLGFRFSTMTMQLAGYANSFEVVGAKWVSQAVAQTSVHPIETFKFVTERSGEVRHRMDTLDRDIDQAIRKMAGKASPLTAAQRFAFHGIGYMDRVVVIPTWIGAYNKALAGGMEEQEAIYAADKAVRQSQGAGAAKDLAAVARGTGNWGQAMKLFTMFYSYLSAVYQRQRTLGRDVRDASIKDLPAIMARAWWLTIVPPVLSELMGGRGPGDGEDWGWWTIKQMLFQSIGAIPIARDVARPAWDGAVGNRSFDYQLSPLQRTGQSGVAVFKDLGRVARGDETQHATRDSLEAAGYWTGLVPGQLAASTQFLVDVGNGDQDPQGAYDWYKGLTTGRIPAKH